MARGSAPHGDQPVPEETRRRQELLAEIARIGYVRRGTLLQRPNRCGTATCRCHADPPRMHGPYWQWTRKVRGKTVTQRVSEEQAALLRTWLENARHLDQLLAEIDVLSTQVTDCILAAASPR
jgi:uncharacterized protein DUF6788